MSTYKGRTKVFFTLEQDEDGYPPVGVESVWAIPTEDADKYVIENTPFFVTSATLGDTVRVRSSDGNLWFDEVVARSQNSLIRVLFHEKEALVRVDEWLKAHGCTTEYSGDFNLLAVSIPERVNLADIQDYLGSEAAYGTVGYEEPILRH